MKWLIERIKSIFLPARQNEFQPPVLGQKPLLFYGIVLLILKIVILLFIFYFPKTDLFSAINTQALVGLINQERVAKNLAPLDVNSKLNEAAQLKAEDMVANNYFDHWSPSGVSPWYWFSQVGYSFSWAGENLAMHFTDTQKVFEAWMASPSHRDNILSPNFKEIGVSVLAGKIGGIETTVSVLDFGSPPALKTAAAPKANDSGKEASVKPKEQTSPEPPAKIAQNEIQNSPQPAAEKKTPQNVNSENLTNLVQVPELGNSRILGAVAFNFSDFAKNLYIYFSLFLIIALAVNIVVKIRIQHLPTIILTLILIGISIGLIFV